MKYLFKPTWPSFLLSALIVSTAAGFAGYYLTLPGAREKAKQLKGDKRYEG
tara:strand:+ start:340 stop:492 length:153 start_codon:yes stop_codon:yes gene_type:complete